MSCVRVFQGTRSSAEFPIEEGNERVSACDLMNDVVSNIGGVET
jgi:hypothetical protein